jgi:hypothetical protein
VKRTMSLAVALGLGALLASLLAAPAAAHEDRKSGKLSLAVGFGDEPAYAGERNSVQLILSDGAGKPVVDLGDAMKVDVTAESTPGQKMQMTLTPNFAVGAYGEPGDYRAFFIPTTPGKYTFRIHGTYKGQKVDQKFTSSKTGFDEVVDPATVKFPVKDPTTAQLDQRLDREVPRLDSALEASQAAQQQARDQASTARTLAVVGIAVGVLGLLVGGIALARRPAGAARPGDRAGSPGARETPAGRA